MIKILPVVGNHADAVQYWDALRVCDGIAVDEARPDYIVVLGGDGTFLGAERAYYKRGVPFVGVGFGHVNFLLNRSVGDAATFVRHLADDALWRHFPINGIAARITTDDGTRAGIGFNDVYVKSADPTQVVRLTIATHEHPRLHVVGDGIIFATPQGSTAYNRSAGGTILPLTSELWCMTGICTQHRIHDVVARQDITIDVHSDGVVAVTDNEVFHNIRRVVLTPSVYKGTIVMGAREQFEQRRYAAV